MRTILEELFLGNIEPMEHGFKNDPKYSKLSNELLKNEEKINSFLNEEERKVFESFINAQLTLDSYTTSENFVYGFKLGAKVMLEVMGGDLA